MRQQIGNGIWTGEVLKCGAPQDDDDDENEICRIEACQPVGEQSCQIESGTFSPISVAVAQGDDVAAEREENRHADEGCAALLLDRIGERRGRRDGCPVAIMRDDDDQRRGAAQAG